MGATVFIVPTEFIRLNYPSLYSSRQYRRLTVQRSATDCYARWQTTFTSSTHLYIAATVNKLT